ncbi:MAG: hypothetical protein LBD10_03260 [Desulfobulbus sp.]|uniref:hypothetical protein n=1 Tax=Desulfobulbus sp. TaxID=895 RepID=UPI00283D6DF4|nr:hypothetical protein [Desulfobulbus sp.]MDR2549207.1 hypothetical protein [Desulfobulbus sp.]
MLVADVIMPEMNDRELAEAGSRLRPDIGVLYISDYTDDIVSKQGILQDDVTF